MRAIIVALVLFVVGCSERVVYVYADAGAPFVGDGSVLTLDAAPEADSDTQVGEDAPMAPLGTCEPDRSTSSVSHADCRRFGDRPICDAITEHCVQEPTALCGACETTAQCRSVDLQAQCVFIPGDAPVNNDSACLVPCSSDGDCAWVQPAYGWSARATCADLPAGRFCLQDWPRPNCRNPDSTRAGETPWE